MFTLCVLNEARELIAALDEIAKPQFSKRSRAATEITVTVPRDITPDTIILYRLVTGDGEQFVTGDGKAMLAQTRDSPSKLGFLQRGNFLQIFRHDVPIASGRIEIRDVDPDWVTVTAYTEEILLQDYRTPDQYSAVLNGLDAADAIRLCLQRWHTVRIKTAGQWDDGSLTDTEAWDAAGGSLWLERDNEGAYKRNGYAIYTFDAGDIPGFLEWDRIRWLADYPPNGLVYSTIQYRFGTSGPWIPSTSWPSLLDEDGDPDPEGQTITGERGILPDQLGLYVGTNNATLQVRVNLYSDDPDSEDDDEEGTSGSSPVAFALEVIARTAGPVSEGDIPISTGHTVLGVAADGATALDVVQQVCEQAKLEFEVVNGALTVAEKLGPDLDDDINLIS